MRLAEELKVYGCIADGDDFLDAMADVFAGMCRDQTPDEMLTRWWDSRNFCMAVSLRFALGEDGIADEMILRRLLNMRKKGGGRIAKVGRGATKRLATDLDCMAIAADPEEFRRIIRTTYLSLHADWPVERFLAHWRDAAHFCGVVAGRLRVERSPAIDNLILRTLLNLRRLGGLNRRERTNPALEATP